MSASTPNPRYLRSDGTHTLRFKLRYPRTWLRMILLWRWREAKALLRVKYGRRRADKLARTLTPAELLYLSKAVFRQRTDKPDDQPDVAASLDPLISVARMGAQRLQRSRRSERP